MPKTIFQHKLQPVPTCHPLLPPMPNLNTLAPTPTTASASANDDEYADEDDDKGEDEDDDLIRALAALQTEEMTLLTDISMYWSNASETSGSGAVATSASESSGNCPDPEVSAALDQSMLLSVSRVISSF